MRDTEEAFEATVISACYMPRLDGKRKKQGQ